MYRADRIQGARVLDRTFAPRYAIELSPLAMSGPVAARVTSSSALSRSITSRRTAPFSPPGRPQRVSGGGPVYVVECLACRKRFRRQAYNTTLNAHKNRDGWDCPGRVGSVVETKW
jgi:hypothetical protein